MELLPAVQERIDADPPPLLYHYTNPRAFINICETQELWAGRASDMNDTTEQSLIFDLAERLLLKSKADGRVEPFIADALVESIRMGRHAPRMQLGAAYTVSLTTEGDSLEQWRAYCPRSGGIALAIPTRVLRSLATARGFLLAPCFYDDESQRSIVAALVEDRLAKYRTQQARDVGDPTDRRDEIVRSFFDTLCQYAPLLKHRSFSMEREWRLVSTVFPASIRKFAPSADGLKMYVPFALAKSDQPIAEDDRLGQMRPLLALLGAFHQGVGDQLPADVGDWRLSQYGCVLGPNRDLMAMWGTTRTLMDMWFGKDTWIVRTQIPYR